MNIFSRSEWLLLLAGLGLSYSLTAAEGQDKFDEVKPGSDLGRSYEVGFMGKTGAPLWIIEKHKDAPSPPNVLSQKGKAVYNRLIKKSLKIRDGSVEAQVQIVAGKQDPEVGLIWRFVDGDHYYYVRANSEEKNIVFYKMQDGKKTSLKSAEIEVGHKWHLLRVEFKGESVSVFFDGKEIITSSDSSMKGPGSLGFFTTADTLSRFDNFKYDGKE